MRWAVCLLGALLFAGCAPTIQIQLPDRTGSGTAPVPPAAPVSAPTSSPTPTPEALPTPAPSSASTPASPGPERPTGPLSRDLRYGQTARLRYFDVTALKQEFGRDGISIGWKVRVCYSAPHPGAGGDGRTRVSNNPWSVRVRDAEGGGQWKSVAISALPHDAGWLPEFRETRLGLGECQEGWLPVKHQNPDLQWGGLTYAPADFGDRITWS